jgi:hypothetical protein
MIVQQVSNRVARSLFMAGMQQASSSTRGQEGSLGDVTPKGSAAPSGHGIQTTTKTQLHTQRLGLQHFISNELADGVKDLNVEGPRVNDEYNVSQHREGKERVSFGTNMATDDESSESGSVHKLPSWLETAIDRFHARKFGGKPSQKLEKREALKVQGLGVLRS